MKISDLTKKLGKIKAHVGDVEVYIYDTKLGYTPPQVEVELMRDVLEGEFRQVVKKPKEGTAFVSL